MTIKNENAPLSESAFQNRSVQLAGSNVFQDTPAIVRMQAVVSLCRRFGLTPHRARLVVELAGIGGPA